MTHPLGFSILISLVRCHPISKLGGSGRCSADLRRESRSIADFLRFSISKEVFAYGGISGSSSDGLGSVIVFGFDFSSRSEVVLEEEEEEEEEEQ